MPHKITFLPEERTVDVRPGTTVLDAALAHRVAIRTRCGGKAGCLMCKVRFAEGSQISPPSENERRKLGSLLDEGWRLACQTRVLGGATAIVPEDPLKAAIRAQLAKQAEEDDW